MEDPQKQRIASKIEQYDRDGFSYFTFMGITAKIDEKGHIEKKATELPIGWNKITKETQKNYVSPNHFGLSVLTGKVSGITVIDFDDKKEYFRMLESYPELKKYRTIYTNKGMHIYCKYDATVKQTTNALCNYEKVDIRNDGGYVYASPTRYILPCGKKCVYQDLGGEILDIPEIIMTDLKQHTKESKKSKKTAEDTDDDAVSEVTQDSKKPRKTRAKKTDPKNVEIILKLLNEGLLDERAMGSYDEWRDMSFAILNSVGRELGFDLFVRFSRINKEKYVADYTKEHWNTIKDTSKKPLTISSICKWAKDADEEKYNTITQKLYVSNEYEASDKILELTSVDGAKMWIFTKGRLYVFEKGMWRNEETAMRRVISGLEKELYQPAINAEGAVVRGKNSYGSSVTLQDKVLIAIKTKCEDNAIRFDEKDHLFAFDNGVLDLITMKFREKRADDYLTLSAGYDYIDGYDNKTEEKEIDDLVKSIFPDEKERSLILNLFAGGFTGKAIERFVVLNGDGRNGKGLISEFLQIIFGEYGYIYAPVTLLTEKDKMGANPEKAKLHNKRIVIMKEPDKGTKIRNDNYKNLTGGGNTSGRDLYAGKNDCEISLRMILFLECNEKCDFMDKPIDADIERIIDVKYPNRFTSIPEDVDNIAVFKADVKYKDMEWKKTHRQAFLKLLLKHFCILRDAKYNVTIPKSVKDRTKEYLDRSDTVYMMWLECFQKSDNENDSVTMTIALDAIRRCSIYTEMHPQEKSKYKSDKIKDDLIKNKTLSKSWIGDNKKIINGIAFRNCFRGFKPIEEEKEGAENADEEEKDPVFVPVKKDEPKSHLKQKKMIKKYESDDD